MKIHSLHPTEIALQIIKEGIDFGQKASDIKADVMFIMDIEEKTADKLIQDLISRKVIYKSFVQDDMIGKILFYTFEKPLPPTIKRIKNVLYPGTFINGADVVRSTGVRYFFKKGVKQELEAPQKVFQKRVMPSNSNLLQKRTFHKVLPDFVRTKFPGMKRTKHAAVTFKRTK